MLKLGDNTRDILVLLLILMATMSALLMGNAVMKWDAVDLYLPWKYFITECISNGELPLWNPYINEGFAQMGDPGTWYPISWVLGLMTNGYSFFTLHLEYILHLFIAGSGFYILAKSIGITRYSALIIASAYMLSGLMIGNAQHIGWVVSAAWFPWVLFFFMRFIKTLKMNAGIKFSLVYFFLLSGGYPGFFIVISYILLSYFIYIIIIDIRGEKRCFQISFWYRLAIISLVFACLASVVLYSSFEMATLITRGAGLNGRTDIWNTLEGSLYPNSIQTVLYPLGASISDWEYWNADLSMVNMYFGVLPLFILFLVIGMKGLPKKVYFFLTLALFAFLFSMGKSLPLRLWLAEFPAMDLFRFPALFRLFFIFSMLLAVGFAFDFLSSLKDYRKRIFFRFGLAIVFLGIMNFSWLGEVEKWKFLKMFNEGWLHFTEIAGKKELTFLQGGISILLITSLFFVFYLKRSFFKSAVIILSILEIITFSRMQLHSTVLKYRSIEDVSMGISNAPEGFPAPDLNRSMTDFSDSAHAKKFNFLWRNLSIFRKTPSPDGISPYAYHLMNTAIESGEFKKITALPFLFTCTSLDNQQRVLTSTVQTDSQINISKFSPNTIEGTVSVDNESYLILNQNYSPHWTATINGEQRNVLKVSDCFMAVKIPKGKADLRFSFHPMYTIIFTWVNIFSLIVLLTYLIIQHFLRRSP